MLVQHFHLFSLRQNFQPMHNSRTLPSFHFLQISPLSSPLLPLFDPLLTIPHLFLAPISFFELPLPSIQTCFLCSTLASNSKENHPSKDILLISHCLLSSNKYIFCINSHIHINDKVVVPVLALVYLFPPLLQCYRIID